MNTYIFQEKDYDFIQLCKNGDVHNVIKYYNENINGGLDISANGFSGFRWCCKFGYIDIIKWFFKVCPTINVDETYAFYDALEFGKVDVAKLLLEFCPNLNIGVPEFIFWKCCKKGDLNVLKYIVENKIYIPNLQTDYDKTGLINAIDKLQCDIIEYLLNIILPNEEIKSTLAYTKFKLNLKLKKIRYLIILNYKYSNFIKKNKRLYY